MNKDNKLSNSKFKINDKVYTHDNCYNKVEGVICDIYYNTTLKTICYDIKVNEGWQYRIIKENDIFYNKD